MAFTGHEDHTITFEEGAELTKDFRAQMKSGDRLGGYISKDSMRAVLDQDDCVGIRYYYGLNKNSLMELVIVGVYANEDDIIGSDKVCLDMSAPCPPVCGSSNILNS